LKKCYHEIEFVKFEKTNPIIVFAYLFLFKFFEIFIYKIPINLIVNSKI